MLRQMNDSFDVAVVGLGPAGAACAALLGSLGVKTLAIERSRAVYDKPRAFALDHEIMRVFEDLGIAEAVAPHTAPFTPSEYYGAEGQLIKRLGALPPPWPLGWPPSMVFEQPAVEALLRKRAAEVAEVMYDEVVNLDLADDYVRLHLRERPHGLGAATWWAATARRARCASWLGIEYEDLEFDQEWLVVDLRVNERGAGQAAAGQHPVLRAGAAFDLPGRRRLAPALGADAQSRRQARSLEAARALDHARRRASSGAPPPTASTRWWRASGAAAACSSRATPRTSSRRSPARACARESATSPT